VADMTMAGDEIAVVETVGEANLLGWSGLSWSAIIAGALTAIAVTIIVVALGSGIGLSLASPFSSSPSTSSLTILGAVWLVFAQAIGFATGGYLAGRLRTNPGRWHSGEVKFRDAANGLVVWAIGVLVSLLLVAGAVGKIGGAAGTVATAGGVAAGTAMAVGQPTPMDYFADILLRRNPQAQAAGGAAAGAAPPAGAPSNDANVGNDQGQRQQVNRILVAAMGPSGISNDDRIYLAQIVSARTGMTMDDAQKRVDDVVNRAKADITKAADTARKAAEFLSFWTFMSLLFGAACAALGGMLGGDLRDEFAAQCAVPTAPR
jgi:hypothetical protein